MRKVALDSVHRLAQRDRRVLYIGSDLGAGTLDKFKHDFPDRFFMEGVSEANVIGMAAGLAMEGFIPYVNTIATFFARRALEQIAVDLCLHKLPVRLIANGGGTVYAPLGPTHLAIEDIALMRCLPNMTVVAPCDAPEMAAFMDQTLAWDGPIYIRLAKGGDAVISNPGENFRIGQGIVMRPIQDVTLVATGICTQRALAVADLLAGDGVSCGVVHMHTVKPLDGPLLLECARRARLLVTVEEHTVVGGLGSAIAEFLVDHSPSMPSMLRLGLPDAFPKEYGSQNSMLETFGLTPAQIAASIRAALARDNSRR
jgi:transketolase